MALFAFASAKGSPGVSTAVAGLARIWPRPVVVADLDPVGGDVPLRYRAPNGDPLETSRGLLSLGAAVRAGGNAEVIDHVQYTAGGMPVLVGVGSPSQVSGLGGAWPHVAQSLKHAPDFDVLADCGRVAPGSPAMPVLELADAVVLCARDGIEDVAHLRERLRGLEATLRLSSAGAVPTGLVVRTRDSSGRQAEDAARLMASESLRVGALGMIAEDAKAARVLRTEADRNVRRSVLMRSLADVARQVQQLARADGRTAHAAGGGR